MYVCVCLFKVVFHISPPGAKQNLLCALALGRLEVGRRGRAGAVGRMERPVALDAGERQC